MTPGAGTVDARVTDPDVWGAVALGLLAALADPRALGSATSLASTGSNAARAATASSPSAMSVGREHTADERMALLESLYHEEAASLVRLARLFTDDRNAAEDLVQEAFVRLHHAADRIDDLGRAAAYLRSIVLNLARDHNRRGLMSLRHFEALTPDAAADAPGDRLELDEQKQRVLEALRSLAPQQRNCLVLRYYVELSDADTADTLGISPNSVRTHCRRGLQRLRQLLEHQR